MLAVGELVDIYYLSSILMHLPVKDLEFSNTLSSKSARQAITRMMGKEKSKCWKDLGNLEED